MDTIPNSANFSLPVIEVGVALHRALLEGGILRASLTENAIPTETEADAVYEAR